MKEKKKKNPHGTVLADLQIIGNSMSKNRLKHSGDYCLGTVYELVEFNSSILKIESRVFKRETNHLFHLLYIRLTFPNKNLGVVQHALQVLLH